MSMTTTQTLLRLRDLLPEADDQDLERLEHELFVLSLNRNTGVPEDLETFKAWLSEASDTLEKLQELESVGGDRSDLCDTETLVSWAKNEGVRLTLAQAYQAWTHHSQKFCAGWLVFEGKEQTTQELLTAWQEIQDERTTS